MSRFKLILMSVFAVLAFSALASASASAEGCGDGGTKSLFCFSPSNVEIHELAVAGESGLSVLASTIGITETKIHCTHGRFAGTLHLLGLAIGEIDYLGCTVEKPAGCSVQGDATHPGLVLAFVHIQTLSGLMGTGLLGLATGNETGTEAEKFAKLEITGGACSVVGPYPVTGLQIVEFPGGETGLAEHEIVAKKAGSKLKLGGNAASFSSTANIHLDSNASWLIMLGT